jgi:hypothetical protein
VGVDDTGGGVETVEDQQPADRPTPPPPPPDQPGAEPEGVPSRSDSRAAAAAVNKPDTSQPADETRADPVAEDKPEPQAESKRAESNEPTGEAAALAPAASRNDRPDDSAQAFSGERDASQDQLTAEAADTGEQPPARVDLSEPLAKTDPTGSIDTGVEHQPSAQATSPADDTPIDGPAPAEAATGETAETDETRLADDLSQQADVLKVEPEGVPSPLDARSDNDRANETPPADLDSTPLDETTEHQTADDWPWADEFAARAQAREKAAANAGVGEKPTVDDTDARTGHVDDTARVSDISTAPADVHADATDQPSKDEQRTDEQRTDGNELAEPSEVNESPSQTAEEWSPDNSATSPEIRGMIDQDADEDTPIAGDRRTEVSEAEYDGLGQQVPDTDSDDEPKSLEFMVDDKTLREHIDPASAGIEEEPPGGRKEPFERRIAGKDVKWADGVDRLGDLPTGEELVKPEDDKRPEDDKKARFDRFREEAWEQGADTLDSVKKHINIFHDAFQRPPAGHPEIKACRPEPMTPKYGQPSHAVLDAGTLVATAVMTAALVGEGTRWIRGTLRKPQEKEES